MNADFSQNVLDEVNAAAVTVDDVKDLDGLTPAEIAAAADEAKSRGLAGKYVLALLNTTGQPYESQLKNRALRQRIYEASVNRGSQGGNEALIMMYDSNDKLIENNTFYDAGVGIYIKGILRKLHVIRSFIDKPLVRHIAVVEASHRERRRNAVDRVVVVVFFHFFVLVLVERVAPLKGTPQR